MCNDFLFMWFVGKEFRLDFMNVYLGFLGISCIFFLLLFRGMSRGFWCKNYGVGWVRKEELIKY